MDSNGWIAVVRRAEKMSDKTVQMQRHGIGGSLPGPTTEHGICPGNAQRRARLGLALDEGGDRAQSYAGHSAAGETEKHRASYGLAVAALEAIAGEKERRIVVDTFGHMPKALDAISVGSEGD
jgi:hypothetical protein